MRFIRDVLRSRSPIGVAPPVSDDCAPIGSTLAAERRTADTSPSLAGDTIPSAWPPGKCAASSRNLRRTSGSLRISPAAAASVRGRLARREWPDISEERKGREGRKTGISYVLCALRVLCVHRGLASILI